MDTCRPVAYRTNPLRPDCTVPRRRWLAQATIAAVTAGTFALSMATTAKAGAPQGPFNEPLLGDDAPAAQRLVRWARETGDHQGLPFAVIDKPAARIHVFSAKAQWLGSAPVLLGAALGDRTAPDIGNRPLSKIRPEERTTPAGRFVTEPGRNLRGEDIVWIDYESAVSLHRVRSVHASERRTQRLSSQGARDKRISYGCVNAPEAFYNQFIAPLFGQSPGVVYVLPDTEPFATIFVAASAYK